MSSPWSRTQSEPKPPGAGRITRPRRVAFGTIALVVAISSGSVLASCSSSTSTPTTTASAHSATPAHAATIAIRNFAFVPSTLQVAPGASVKVFNEDQVAHTLTASHGQFNTGNIPAGQSMTFTAPATAGSYAYNCTIHPYMTGTLVVS